MSRKIYSKDDMTEFLKKISNCTTIEDVQEKVEEIADELGIDLSEVDEEEFEEIEEIGLFKDDLFDDEDDY